MPSPQSGNAGQAVSPAAPATPQDADDSQPGGMGSVQANPIKPPSTQSSSAQVKPYKSNPAKKSWIEIAMVGEDNKPIPGEHYQITLPDGTVADGTLDEKGLARVDGIDSGNCQITFPDLDQSAWEKA